MIDPLAARGDSLTESASFAFGKIKGPSLAAVRQWLTRNYFHMRNDSLSQIARPAMEGLIANVSTAWIGHPATVRFLFPCLIDADGTNGLY